MSPQGLSYPGNGTIPWGPLASLVYPGPQDGVASTGRENSPMGTFFQEELKHFEAKIEKHNHYQKQLEIAHEKLRHAESVGDGERVSRSREKHALLEGRTKELGYTVRTGPGAGEVTAPPPGRQGFPQTGCGLHDMVSLSGLNPRVAGVWGVPRASSQVQPGDPRCERRPGQATASSSALMRMGHNLDAHSQP
ncbi:hypothetical protein P7K49_005966 [Saguinus oedipus]|uniref:Alpha-2-macroglobulin RAP C-terminal domain-containing protein n=1 Tax=Saguinus oedipus TaxID=9490 RepID=A0ABQ9W119_SAGOE|nr:hypothetical protein P7K49_005966 [Saguinus oedipus]